MYIWAYFLCVEWIGCVYVWYRPHSKKRDNLVISQFVWCWNCVFFLSRLFSTLKLRGGSPGGGNKTTTSQLMPLATFVPSLGRCGQGPWLENLAQIRKCHFLSDLACFDISSKKRCLYRLFIYHFKAHTISNKLV